MFYEDEGGGLKLTQVPWDCSVRFAMPVETWRRMIEAHYPFRSWLALDRDTIERLSRLKTDRALPSFDAALRVLLDEQDGVPG